MQAEPMLIRKLTVKELLTRKEKYVIPIYQRNYAWEATEIEQLIQDVIDYSIHHNQRQYYIGTLVVSEERHKSGTVMYAIIDGQQRLTTLSILSAVIKNTHKDVDMAWLEELNLSFASRPKSDLSMKAVYDGAFEDEEYEINIRSAYDICERELLKKTNEYRITIKQFADYLYQYVVISEVPLPEGIDLNHYFEIMNTRGEQLEKHEILKVKLMECFNGYHDTLRSDCETCFDLIWNACADMEKYVQYGFSPDQRALLFGETDWDSLAVSDFDQILAKLKVTLANEKYTQEATIEDILSGKAELVKNGESEDGPDRYNSVVNFQNFLLHVLRVQVQTEDVALDDKRLLEFFERQVPKQQNERIAFVKSFIYNLLKCKFLFDKYILKREFTAGTDRWSLKSLKKYGVGKGKISVTYVNTFGEEGADSSDADNRRILMLLSMFHVSVPSMVYKNWLNAAMNYLFHEQVIYSRRYVRYLEHVARTFVFDKYLAKEPKGYFELVYKLGRSIQRSSEQLDLSKLRFGSVNNLVFNYMDYLIWCSYKESVMDPRVKAFEYTFRSSVEHYHPQNPMNNDIEKIDPTYLHSFGNLCLISHDKNSRLSNFSAQSKKEFYSKSMSIDSLKQFLMMQFTNWRVEEIKTHEEDMINMLLNNLNDSS